MKTEPISAKIIGEEIHIEIDEYSLFHLKECLIRDCSSVAKAKQEIRLIGKEPKRVVLHFPQDKVGTLFGMDIYIDEAIPDWKLKECKYRMVK